MKNGNNILFSEYALEFFKKLAIENYQRNYVTQEQMRNIMEVSYKYIQENEFTIGLTFIRKYYKMIYSIIEQDVTYTPILLPLYGLIYDVIYQDDYFSETPDNRESVLCAKLMWDRYQAAKVVDKLFENEYFGFHIPECTKDFDKEIQKKIPLIFKYIDEITKKLETLKKEENIIIEDFDSLVSNFKEKFTKESKKKANQVCEFIETASILFNRNFERIMEKKISGKLLDNLTRIEISLFMIFSICKTIELKKGIRLIDSFNFTIFFNYDNFYDALEIQFCVSKRLLDDINVSAFEQLHKQVLDELKSVPTTISEYTNAFQMLLDFVDATEEYDILATYGYCIYTKIGLEVEKQREYEKISNHLEDDITHLVVTQEDKKRIGKNQVIPITKEILGDNKIAAKMEKSLEVIFMEIESQHELFKGHKFIEKAYEVLMADREKFVFDSSGMEHFKNVDNEIRKFDDEDILYIRKEVENGNTVLFQLDNYMFSLAMVYKVYEIVNQKKCDILEYNTIFACSLARCGEILEAEKNMLEVAENGSDAIRYFISNFDEYYNALKNTIDPKLKISLTKAMVITTFYAMTRSEVPVNFLTFLWVVYKELEYSLYMEKDS